MATLKTIQDFADSHDTSVEIVSAIYDIAAEGDEHRMWESPTPREQTKIMAQAWKRTNADRLWWGVDTYCRSQKGDS